MTGAERTGDKKYTATRGTISMIGSWGLAAVPCLAALVLAGSAWASAGQSSSDPAGGPPPPAPGDMQERRVVLVTGSTSGLGEELALRLGRTGAHVIVHGRNVERGNAVVAAIEAEGSGSARFYRADFASFDQVREFAETIMRDYDRLDVLINNAGILGTFDQTREPSRERRLSADGHEVHFQVNYLSHVLLTRMLLPMIVESVPSRIVNVSSGLSTMRVTIDFDNVMLEEGYNSMRAYNQSKLAQIFFTFDLAEELEGTGVIVSALHPETMMDTPLARLVGDPRATVDEGADAVMNLVETPELESGQYFMVQTPTRANPQAYDEAARTMLRELSQELTGLN